MTQGRRGSEPVNQKRKPRMHEPMFTFPCPRIYMYSSVEYFSVEEHICTVTYVPMAVLH